MQLSTLALLSATTVGTLGHVVALPLDQSKASRVINKARRAIRRAQSSSSDTASSVGASCAGSESSSLEDTPAGRRSGKGDRKKGEKRRHRKRESRDSTASTATASSADSAASGLISPEEIPPTTLALARPAWADAPSLYSLDDMLKSDGRPVLPRRSSSL